MGRYFSVSIFLVMAISTPRLYVIDGQGMIQHIDIHGEQLDAAVDKLVANIAPPK